MAMLLNLASLAHRTRTRWWQQHPPARLYAIDDIVCWPEQLYGPPPTYFTKHRYVWSVWTPEHTGTSAFWWLSSAAFRAHRIVTQSVVPQSVWASRRQPPKRPHASHSPHTKEEDYEHHPSTSRPIALTDRHVP